MQNIRLIDLDLYPNKALPVYDVLSYRKSVENVEFLVSHEQPKENHKCNISIYLEVTKWLRESYRELCQNK